MTAPASPGPSSVASLLEGICSCVEIAECYGTGDTLLSAVALGNFNLVTNSSRKETSILGPEEASSVIVLEEDEEGQDASWITRP